MAYSRLLSKRDNEVFGQMISKIARPIYIFDTLFITKLLNSSPTFEYNYENVKRYSRAMPAGGDWRNLKKV
jgi:hypothetical protein